MMMIVSTATGSLRCLLQYASLLCSGVLQGDPASCFLYNLTLQPLFDLLAQLNIGVPIPILGTLSGLAFADDSLFFLEASHHGLSQLPLFLACLDAYAAESGAAINTHKSAFWLVGTPKAEDEAATRKLAEGLAAYGLSSSTTSGPLSHLGHPLPSDASEPHPKPLLARLSAIARRAACFRTQGVDIYTRVLTSNRLLGSRLWHSIAVGPLPVDLSRLTLYLARRHNVPPAVLLIRSGAAFGRLPAPPFTTVGTTSGGTSPLKFGPRSPPGVRLALLRLSSSTAQLRHLKAGPLLSKIHLLRPSHGPASRFSGLRLPL
ncbi:hypothetical protein CF335_g8786 [Tilletia laevis]|nr:hypothetical protein CF335_g8786 [Tilletia laevis]